MIKCWIGGFVQKNQTYNFVTAGEPQLMSSAIQRDDTDMTKDRQHEFGNAGRDRSTVDSIGCDCDGRVVVGRRLNYHGCR